VSGTGTRTWRSLWVETADLVGDVNEARWLCQEASGMDATVWVSGLDDLATQRAVAHLDAMVARRVAGEPLAYVLGSWAFRQLELLVDRRVLIPRPETEVVVDVALDLARRMAPPLTIADLGTGSGAIALSLARELPLGDATVWATDAADAALDVARANLAGLGRSAAHVRLARGSWWDALPPDLASRFDLVVSNPPYVGRDDDVDESVVAWEPMDALRAGADGLDALRVIIDGAPSWLRPGGWLVCEIGAAQGKAVHDLAVAAGLIDVDVLPDLAQRDRLLTARFPAD
jgi:release factor glutamine methyltransferase